MTDPKFYTNSTHLIQSADRKRETVPVDDAEQMQKIESKIKVILQEKFFNREFNKDLKKIK